MNNYNNTDNHNTTTDNQLNQPYEHVTHNKYIFYHKNIIQISHNDLPIVIPKINIIITEKGNKEIR